MKGQVADLSAAAFKGDDGLKTSFFAETTSKILVLASDGKVFTLEASKLPGGRGQGEPIRSWPTSTRAPRSSPSGLMRRARNASSRPATATASSSARTNFCPRPARAGRCSMSRAPASAALIVSAAGDHVAIIGQPQAARVPVRAAQRNGARQGHAAAALQGRRPFRRQGLRDRRRPHLARPAGRTFTVAKPELKEWIGNRAEAGRLPPKGFPKTNWFEGLS